MNVKINAGCTRLMEESCIDIKMVTVLTPDEQRRQEFTDRLWKMPAPSFIVVPLAVIAEAILLPSDRECRRRADAGISYEAS